MAGFATIDEALQDLRDGKLILVIDDPDRENEGDLICAAEFATTENVNAMASLAKGLICMPMSKEMTKKLGLDQMVAVNTDNHQSAFTVSIDHVDTTTRYFCGRAFADGNEVCGRWRETGRFSKTGAHVSS